MPPGGEPPAVPCSQASAWVHTATTSRDGVQILHLISEDPGEVLRRYLQEHRHDLDPQIGRGGRGRVNAWRRCYAFRMEKALRQSRKDWIGPGVVSGASGDTGMKMHSRQRFLEQPRAGRDQAGIKQPVKQRGKV